MNRYVRAAVWLASAADDPGGCLREWSIGPRGVVLLPAGRRWDALSVPERVGHSLLSALARRAARRRPGPVIADRRAQQLVLLLAPGSTAPPLGRGARYLTNGTWLAVPALDRPVSGLQWLVRPDDHGTLFTPADVYRVLDARRAAW
ncbi:hypothetical protein J7E93_30985 [Streptomyces sp. ISL-36]|uniref:hypothetical protein n=1 Tax=Streptomyces sp. ISL-36 TaxID=2819182 RepID=UPI001BEC0E50|nr:hypothetical protein [Streptomyces sp. ISL-36]MBT2444445.1 hypothetical protein [Streptomyces sp. ISL-36]